MTKTQIFPAILIFLNLCASGMDFWQKDLRHALYWLFAAAITATVTF
jgi:hypothetical protein